MFGPANRCNGLCRGVRFPSLDVPAASVRSRGADSNVERAVAHLAGSAETIVSDQEVRTMKRVPLLIAGVLTLICLAVPSVAVADRRELQFYTLGESIR